MKPIKLHYQLSNGSWVDCDVRNDEFFEKIIKNNPTMTYDEIVTGLNAGRELRNHPEDWYSFCRSAEVAEERAIKIEARQKAAYEANMKRPAKLTGQLWEECPRCGQSPVYMSASGLCADCANS